MDEGHNCTIEGVKMKIFINAGNGGLQIMGHVDRLYYAGLQDPVEWATQPSLPTPANKSGVTGICTEYIS